MEHMNISEILDYLPHRYPFVLIDRVLECEVEKHLVAIKNVTINEYFFNGHFPNQPIMPGVLIIEALAQACGVLALRTNESRGLSANEIHYFAAVDKVRFKRTVVPGDQLLLKVNLLKNKRDFWKFTGEATVDGMLACSAEITTAKGD